MICTGDLFVPYKGVRALFILFKATFKKKKKKKKTGGENQHRSMVVL